MAEPLIHDPGNTDPLDRLYVFLSVDEKGDRGIVAEILPGLGSTPLVTGSLKAAELMKGIAAEVSRRTGKPIGMFSFRRVEQLWQTEGKTPPK